MILFESNFLALHPLHWQVMLELFADILNHLYFLFMRNFSVSILVGLPIRDAFRESHAKPIGAIGEIKALPPFECMQCV